MTTPKETKAILPEFFIAFALPHATRSPTQDEIEEIRNQTVAFWGKQLAESYPKPFLKLDLQVVKSIFGERTGEEKRNLADEFNMYLEVNGEVTFNAKFRSLPSGDEVFREMVAGNSMDYLVAFVRGIKSANLFATALEVTARRLHAPTGSPGGSVVCPSFFVAFSIDQDDPEAQIPDGALPEDMMTEWNKRTHKAMEDNLRKEWPDTFERLDLETSTADKGSNKPDDRFHLYMENEAVVTFSSDPPSPEAVFQVLMKSANTDATVYLLSMHDMEGTPFSCVTMVTIQLVGLEMPKPEELPPPPEKEQDPQDEGEGDPEEGEEEAETDLVTMNVPIFLALVANVDPPAERPKEEELLQFKDLMVRFFYTTVKKEVPHVQYLDLRNERVKFGAGIPEERFNMCVEYDALLQFKKDDEVPEEKMIQSLIMEVNLGSVLAHVKNLEPLCFKHTTEVTMRQKSREKKDAPVVPDSAFEAAVDAPPLLMPPPPPEPAPRAAPIPIEKPKEKPKKVAEKVAPPSPKPEPEPEKPKKPKKVVEKPAPPSPKPEPEPKKPEEKPKKPKKVEEKPAPPSPKKEAQKPVERPRTPPPREKSPPPPQKMQPEPNPKSPTKSSKKDKPKKDKEPPVSPKPKEEKPPAQKVQSSDIYVALKLDTYGGPPTDEQMEQLRKNTCAYFITRLKEEFPTTFADLELIVGKKAFGEEEVRNHVGHQDYSGMNIYIEWITAAEFKVDNVPAKVVGSSRKSVVTDGLPTPYELTKAIVKDCDIIKYLLEYVRVIEDSDFMNATSCHLQQRIEGKD